MRLATLLAILLCVAASAAEAQTRRALVIGNSRYTAVPVLPNPANDARAVAQRLQGLGFQSDLVLDAGQARFTQAVDQFARAIANADVAVFFYAGHGVAVDGQNYLVPVDATLERREDLARRFVTLNSVLLRMTDSGARATLVILDACRDDPFRGSPGARGIARGRGLSEVSLNRSSLATGPGGTTQASGTLIAFATGPGTVAEDGTGQHSPFTTALLANLGAPGIEINSVFNRVRQSVWEGTGRRQLPWSQSAMVGDLYLAGPPRAAPGAPPRILRAPPP